MTRIAIIDMGTNTFHLLIADAGPTGSRIIYRDQEAVKIGMAGINEGIISEGGVNRAILAMQKFKHKIDQCPASKVYAFGTSAFRNAANGVLLAEKIKSLTGISVHIISGDQEADFIYAGVRAACDLDEEATLIMDIGAGSVEYIIADQKQIFWKQSFEIGGQRLLEKFQKHDPIDIGEINALDLFLEKSLSPLLKAFEKFKPEILVGSSGSFDTLSEIYCIRKDIRRTSDEPETALSEEGFYEIYHELICKNRNERMQIKGMIEMRVDMIVVSSCLIRFVLEKHKFKRIRVSTYSLKEGVLAQISCGARKL